MNKLFKKWGWSTEAAVLIAHDLKKNNVSYSSSECCSVHTNWELKMKLLLPPAVVVKSVQPHLVRKCTFFVTYLHFMLSFSETGHSGWFGWLCGYSLNLQYQFFKYWNWTEYWYLGIQHLHGFDATGSQTVEPSWKQGGSSLEVVTILELDLSL